MGAQNQLAIKVTDNLDNDQQQAIGTNFRHNPHDCESLSENMTDELEAWVRQSMVKNGFVDS
jgi:hypothetical protein